MTRLRLAALFAALALLGPPPAPMAAVGCPGLTFTQPSGDWGVGANWSNNQTPVASDDVCIGSGQTVTITTNASARVVTIAAGGTLIMNNTSGSFNSGLTASSVANDGTITLTCSN